MLSTIYRLNMNHKTTQAELEAYLDEELPADAAADVEAALRGDERLVQRLVEINQRRDAGIHSLGEIWRRHRVSCPSRQELGRFLLDTLDREQADFIRFHVEVTGCRFCLANLEDLKSDQQEEESDRSTRRKKYFDSSAGHLGK